MNTRKKYVKYGVWSVLICLCMALVSFIIEKRFRAGNTGDGTIYQFTIAKKGIMIDDATCYAWIPEDVGTIRTVIVHLHGCTREGDAWQMMYDIQWRELARKWHAVLLAPKFITGSGNSKTCINWYNPDNGTDKVFLEMLDTLALKAGHPEIKTIPWALWGHSGGSIWVTSMTGRHPERVAVTVAQACGVDISDIPAALKVPILHHNGIQDLCYNNATLFANGRKKGALWAHAVNPVVESAMDGHQVHDMRFLAIPWIDACLAMRLPEKAGDNKLRDMNTANAWLGDTAKRTVAPATSYKGDKLAACWFPNKDLAEKWVEYMATGTVTDKTPPPAPYGLIASYWGNNLMLRWHAEPDLESGIKTFIVYRDGVELKTMQYKTKTTFSKLFGFQRWNDGDQPAPIPAPEMTFTDNTVDDKTTHTYEISSVNWSDVQSKKSVPLTLKNGKVE
jgi:pimeloyl-ACP methyl ester carboxylesterase